MADDINGDKMTDYYTHAEYAKRLDEITEEIMPAKRKRNISPYKLFAGALIILFILLIITYFVRFVR